MPRRMRSAMATAAVALLAFTATTSVVAHDDYLPLNQPEIFESPCVKKWSEMTAHFDATARDGALRRPLARETEASELHVNLTVRLDRFESRYVGFNTRTYNGRIPAPTIKVCPGDKLVVHVRNQLGDGTANLTNLHVHGLHVSPTGHHDNVLKSIAPGGERRYEYEIRPDHPAGTFWYHPHSHGLVNTQLSGLMAGALIVADRPGDFPKEIADMDEHVLILQGICVEKCHIIYDSIVHALQNDYAGGDMMMMMDMNMNMSSGMDKDMHMDMQMDMGSDSDDDDAPADEFPIDLRVEKNSPLNDTSLLHVYVNGQYLPELHMQPGEFKRLRYVNAIPNNVAELVAPGCEMHIISRDGVYLRAPSQKEVVVLPPGSRADVSLRCNATGTFFLETESSPKRNQLLGKVNRHRVPSQKIVSLRVFGDEPVATMALPTQLPKPPVYMADTMHLGDGGIRSDSKYNYEFSVWMDEHSGAMNYGVNKQKFDHQFVNYSMVVDEPQEWELSVRGYGHECQDINHDDMDHRSNLDFSMNKMLDDEQRYEAREAEKKKKKTMSHCHAMTHPFHMHGSHFQITRVDNALDPDELLFGLGEWRDTIPLYRTNTQIRFTPRDHMLGRILTHCHFAAHSDNGMAQLVEVRKTR